MNETTAEEPHFTASCTMETGLPLILQPCHHMKSLIGRTHAGNGGGIAVQHLVRLSDDEPTRQLWVIHSGVHKKCGVILNFCPMCGADLRPLTAGLGKKENQDA